MSPLPVWYRRACARLRGSWPLLLAGLVLTASSTAARAPRHGAKERAEPDLVAIAAVLLEGGDAARAISLLQGIAPDDERIDRIRLGSVLGLAALEVQDYALARSAFSSAIDESERRRAKADEQRGASRTAQRDAARATPAESGANELRTLHGHLALATFALGDCEATLEALQASGVWATERVAGFAMRAECLQRGGQPAAALEVLRAGQARHAPAAELWEREFELLCSLSLFQELRVRADAWLPQQSEEEALRLLAQLSAAGAHDVAIELGERMRWLHGATPRISAALAHAYAARGAPLSAAQLFEDAARRAPEHVLAASSLYRSAGWLTFAELLSARAEDSAGKVRQRFGLLLEQQRFDEANALRGRLQREGLLEDDEIRYALAYSLYQSRALADARSTLRGITRPSLFRQAAELASAIEACEQEGWQCR